MDLQFEYFILAKFGGRKRYKIAQPIERQAEMKEVRG